VAGLRFRAAGTVAARGGNRARLLCGQLRDQEHGPPPAARAAGPATAQPDCLTAVVPQRPRDDVVRGLPGLPWSGTFRCVVRCRGPVRRPGLPPGPIGNPGIASLEAAANPPKTKFLYYVQDCNRPDHHVFARTQTAFDAAVARYRSARPDIEIVVIPGASHDVFRPDRTAYPAAVAEWIARRDLDR